MTAAPAAFAAKRVLITGGLGFIGAKMLLVDVYKIPVLWSLGDISPMGSLTATLTLSATPGGGDFTPLDGGPVAHATRWRGSPSWSTCWRWKPSR